MEHVTGVQLLRKWPHMSGGQKVLCIAALYEKLKQIVGLEFPTYGSIYPFTSSLDFLSKIQLETGSQQEAPHYQTSHPTKAQSKRI
ncbi:hypothetical protein PENSUB_10928 [Penicillium subrubescens]|uniref:Uncharacterized protein n=1 Tax=Penicillium subrubescens TaxID=1316194 RepID=A0A1Q5T6M6_9EURO|nr:hypothetical protein PENSUB_10928 [Penicillium subrubescens]